MVFVVVQIKCRLKVVKTWYGCLIPDSCTLSDLYNEFSAGQLDRSLPLLDEYLGATVESFVGRTKTDLIRVNSQCAVGEVVGSLGQYVFAKANLTCNSPTEIPYYGTGNDPICYHCGTENSLRDDSTNYPVCEACLLEKKDLVTKRSK